MRIEALREEHQTELIGKLLYERVTSLVKRQLRNRDPRVYALDSHDYRDGLEDVVQRFVLDVLIGERQIDYVMSTAVEIADFDALMNRQIRRYLSRSRRRTIVDNVIDRSLPVLRAPPFEARTAGGEEEYLLSGGRSTLGPPQADSLRRAADLARSVRTIGGGATERTPPVYDADGLQSVLHILLSTCGLVTRRDLDQFFQRLLTPWLPSFLDLDEGLDFVDRELSPVDRVLVEEQCRNAMSALSRTEKLILIYKRANRPDEDVARALGKSRQTVVKYKKTTFAKLEAQLTGLPENLQEAVIGMVVDAISVEGIWADAP